MAKFGICLTIFVLFGGLAFASESSQFKSISKAESDIPDADIQRVLGDFQEVDDFLPGFIHPRAVNLTVQREGEGDQASLRGDLILISLSWGYNQRLTNLESKAIRVHEYGHLLFEANISTYLPEWKINQDNLKRLVNESKECVTGNGPNCLEKSREALDFPDAFRISFPYTELFADVIAVIGTKSGTIISTGLSKEYPGEEVAARDFTISRNVQSWTETEAHARLAPVRSFLWEHYRDDLISSEHPERLPTCILKATAPILRAKLNGKSEQSISAENQDLIKAITISCPN